MENSKKDGKERVKKRMNENFYFFTVGEVDILGVNECYVNCLGKTTKNNKEKDFFYYN